MGPKLPFEVLHKVGVEAVAGIVVRFRTPPFCASCASWSDVIIKGCFCAGAGGPTGVIISKSLDRG